MMSRPKGQREFAYRKLLDLIGSGELPLHKPISERQIAEDLGVGRTPVREAMRALATEGLLEIRPARGTFVKRIGIRTLRELFDTRLALELKAVELAAERRGGPAIAPYRDLLEGSRALTATDIKKTYEIGAQFHVAVFEAAQNQVLQEIYLPIRNRFKATIGMSVHYDQDWVRKGIDDHLGILDAIEEGDAITAQRRMAEHLDASFESKSDILRNLEAKSGLRGAQRESGGASESTVLVQAEE